MKYFEILEPFKSSTARCFVDGEIRNCKKVDIISDSEYAYTYKYTPELKQVDGKVIVADLLPYSPTVSSSPALKRANAEIEPYLKSLIVSKVPRNVPLIDLLPERVLISFYSARQAAVLEYINSNNISPGATHDHHLQVEHLISSISGQALILNERKVRNERQLKIIRSQQRFVEYDSRKTITGRLSTRKGSFPIMTLGSSERSFIEPTNDLFIEFDFNAAEIRTLLYFSGQSQPECDIHEWHSTLASSTRVLPRKLIKEKFFAWLYNPNSKSKDFEKFYDKKAYLKYYANGMISTPYGRQIRVQRNKALNYLLQSTSSDMNLEQSVKVNSLLSGKRTFIKFLMHDSLVLDVHREDLPLLHRLYNVFCKTRLGDFLVGVRHGKDYGSMEELKWST